MLKTAWLTCMVLWSLLLASPTWALNTPASAAKRVVRVAVPAKPTEKPLALTEEQLAVAPRVATGVLPCELSQKVSVLAHPHFPGHFVIEAGKQRFAMVPVATTTGAIRLEDAARGAVWLQLANKSMLMDQRQGRRLADACMSAEQQVVALALEKNPAPNLLEPLPVPAAQAGSAMK
jgi:hypothetical protein